MTLWTYHRIEGLFSNNHPVDLLKLYDIHPLLYSLVRGKLQDKHIDNNLAIKTVPEYQAASEIAQDKEVIKIVPGKAKPMVNNNNHNNSRGELFHRKCGKKEYCRG